MNKKRNIIIIFILALLVTGCYILFSKSKAAGGGNDSSDPYANYKTAEWSNASHTTADITLNYYSGGNKGILWLGTLCNGHSLGAGYHSIQAMNQLAKNTNIDYAFFGTPTEEKTFTATGLIERAEYLGNVSAANYDTSNRNVVFDDYQNYGPHSGKKVYLVGTQAAHGTIGPSVSTHTVGNGVRYLTLLLNDDVGTGPDALTQDYLHIWGGYNTEFTNPNAAYTGYPYYNEDLQDLVEQATGTRPNVPKLHFTDGYIWADGQHANALAFAKEIVKKLGTDGKEYDTLVLSFVGLFEMANVQNTSNAQARIFRQAADLLQNYYDNGKVIWLMSNDSSTSGGYPVLSFLDDHDYAPSSLSAADQTTFKNRYLLYNARYLRTTGYDLSGNNTTPAYNTWTYLTQSPIKENYMLSAFHDDTNLARNTKIPRFYYTRNMFQTMALFDPTTYRANTYDLTESTPGVPKNTSNLPAVSASVDPTNYWSRSNGELAVVYNNATNIVNIYKKSNTFNKLVIDDYVAQELTPTGVTAYYWNGTEYVEAGTAITVTYTVSNDNLVQTTLVPNSNTVFPNSIIDKPVKIVIHTALNSCSFDNSGDLKNTNVKPNSSTSYARINTYYCTGGNCTARETFDYEAAGISSPQLKKTFSIVGDVTGGTFTGGSNHLVYSDVSGGDVKTFTYAPATNYKLSLIEVDGISQDISSCSGNSPASICSSYTFTMPTTSSGGNCKDHTLNVEYERIKANVKIKKQVKGNMAKTDDYFPFSIKIYEPGTYTISGLTAGSNLCTGVASQATTATVTGATTTPTATTICLKHGDIATIADVPTDIDVEISETNNNSYSDTKVAYCDKTTCKNTSGYPKTTFNNTSLVNNYAVLDTSIYGNNANEITFTNTKAENPPSGLSINNIPYIALMVVLALISSTVAYILQKRQKEKIEVI